MTTKKSTFRILRFKADVIDPPEWYTYCLAVDKSMSVLDALEKIRITEEPTLMYRHSCHHSSCGTCACLINDAERLLCTTNVWGLGTKTVTLSPLKGFPRIGDLVVDMEPFFRAIDEEWTYLQSSSKKKSDVETRSEDRSFIRFEDCIECGSCISACPVFGTQPQFLGPAALAALHREMGKVPHKKDELLSLAGNSHGVHLCDRALKCSRVCPTAVYPAHQIAKLKKIIADE